MIFPKYQIFRISLVQFMDAPCLEEELVELVTLNKKLVTANGNILFGLSSIVTNIEVLKQNMKENKSPLMIKNIQ